MTVSEFCEEYCVDSFMENFLVHTKSKGIDEEGRYDADLLIDTFHDFLVLILRTL